MSKRKALSKKQRFDVFKRDLFTCQYCGSTPPRVVLEVDHIEAVANGGSNDPDNLITACFDCNRGKQDGHLTEAPPTVANKAERLAEAEEQIKAYNRMLAAKRRRENKLINELEDIIENVYPKSRFLDSTKEAIRHNFIQSLSKDQLYMAMHKAVSRPDKRGPKDAYRYFCGVCWRLIKDDYPWSS